MRPLHPSLKVIENKLFMPSKDLLLRWAADNPSLSQEMVSAKAIEESESPPLPPFLSELIDQRIAAREHYADVSVPNPGQILRIDQIDWNLSGPLAVLINEPTKTKNLWYGWMVASETDYASHWDMLLEPEDQPFDPLASMIQIWNPVHIYVPSNAPVLATLKPERLQAVRALADEFATEPEPDISLSQPDHIIAPRTTFENFSILTGSPISGDDDPRQRYQALYHRAAYVLRKFAVPDSEPEKISAPSFLGDIIHKIKYFIQTPWGIAIPAMAFVLVVSFVTYITWPLNPIDKTYETVVAQKTDEMVDEWRDFTFIWEDDVRNTFAFSPTGQPTPATKAFSAGLLMARESLLENHDFVLPAPLKGNWLKTEWAPYFDLGRWTFLLWTASQSEMPPTFWDEQRDIFAQLKKDFVKRQETENDAKFVVSQLEEKVQPFLEKLPSADAPKIYDDLGFGLEEMMSLLASN
ncbi:MAG: hypothetical protein ABFS56_12010 [Pseudomonadota bacterium]